MSPLGILALIMAAVLGTLTMWRLNEPAVRTTVTLVDKARWIIGILFLGLAAWHFLRSGNPVLIAIAVLGFAFLTGFMLVERPWTEVI